MKEIEERGAAELERLLKRIPRIKFKSLKIGTIQNDPGFDVQFRIELDGKQHTLIGEVKGSGQPRYAREAILRLKVIAARTTPPAIPVFIAPYLTESTRDLCFQQGVSYLDFEGNARMAFDSVYLEIVSPHRPSSPRREYRSLFKGRSAKVLRVLLSSPDRTWRLAELAQESRISIGHVSNVQSSLLDREWANRNEQGLLLTSPRALLDAWSAAYERPLAAERRFYTTLHGSMLEEALRDFFISTKENYPGGATSLAEDCRKLLEHESARTGYGFIDAKFGTVESYGPTSVRLFVEESAALGDQTPEQWQQDAYGQVNEWLIALGLRTPQ